MAAAKKAEKKLLTCIPPIRYDETIIATVKMSHRRKIPFICYLFKCQILSTDSAQENGAIDVALLGVNYQNYG